MLLSPWFLGVKPIKEDFPGCDKAQSILSGLIPTYSSERHD